LASPGADPKRPFGGLVPSQPKGTRAYQDAATYNHHLAQHQAYTAQAQSQAANTFRNPYITPQSSQHSTPAYATSEGINPTYQSQQQQPAPTTQQQPQHPQYTSNPPAPGQRGLTHQSSTGQLGTNAVTSQYPNHTTGGSLGTAHLTTNIPANPYIPNSRARANTINQMDSVPPALARLQHMNQDVIAGRNTLTPILNRDDAMREWERRQAGKVTATQPYPQLEYLQQQAEMAATTGMSSWTTSHTRYPAAPSKLSLTYQPQTVLADEDNNNTRRDAVMSNVRAAARNDGAGGVYSTSNIISSPPQAYTGNTATSGNRYPTANYNNQGQPQAASTFDSIDRRTEVGNMYVPIQPDQYQGYPPVGPPLSSVRHVAPPAQAGPAFHVIPGQNATQQRNPFQIVDGQQTGSKDTRRGNGDIWPR
jgi:dual specificity protein kinase YAK1